MRQTQQNSTVTFGLVLAIACGLIFGKSAHANPSTKNPNQPFKAHNTINGADKQIQAMYAKYDEWEQLVVSSLESAKAGKRFPHQQLSRIFPETYRGMWYAEHLQAMGEPAGYDLHRKFTALRKAMFEFCTWLAEYQQKEIAALKKATPNRVKTLERVEQLVQEGKLEEAERQIQALHLKQLVSVFYLRSSQASPYETPVVSAHQQVRQKLNQKRRQAYVERAQESMQAYASAIETLQSESKRVAGELASSPTVTLSEGQSGDAADAIAYVRTLWGNASAALSRSVAVAWAFGGGNARDIAEPYTKQATRAQTIANSGLVEILRSAAQSTPADKLPMLIPRVTTELSVIDRRLAGGLDEGVKAALDQLVAKNALVAEQAQRYTDATFESMRWMRRYTRQQVEKRGAEYPEASVLLNRKRTPEEPAQPKILGPVSNRERVLTPGTMTGPSHWLVGDADAMVGEKVSDGATLRLAPAAKMAIVQQDARHYTSLPATLPLDQYVAELRSVLLLDESHGPLDLPAANANSSVELQEFYRVGGTISGLTVEPSLSRFATMPDAAHALVPMDRLPSIDTQGPVIQQVIWRMDLQPDWVAHELFFARAK